MPFDRRAQLRCVLTKSTPGDPDAFPTLQLFYLALVRLAEPVALTSIFPYAWRLVINYNVTDEKNAALYAGLLISSFSLAEAVTGMFWGGLSDRIGRKPVLLLGCAGTLTSLLVVGVATNFWVALFGRALGGALNGNIGVIQTMVGELVRKPEHEPKAYAVMPFIWSVGTIIGPSIGGYFAEPAVNFPSMFPPGSLFANFPYLLPNLICALMLLVSIILGVFCLFETHPDMQPWSTQSDLDNTTAETPLMPTAGATAHAAANLATESYGTFDAVDVREEQNWRVKLDGRPLSVSSASNDKVFSRKVVMLVIALGIFTYHTMSYDHLLPIFFQDARSHNPLTPFAGGLGLSIQHVGLIMSVNGLIALFIQAIVFPLMASWMGIYRLFILVTIGHPIAYIIVPYLTVLPEKWLYPSIYACLAIRNFFSIVAYPIILIMLKEASPSSSCLGKINGLAASTGAACRTVASPVAGWLYGVGSATNCTALAWWTTSIVAVFGAAQVPFVRRIRNKTATVGPAAACKLLGVGEERGDGLRRDVVHILVDEAEPEENAQLLEV